MIHAYITRTAANRFEMRIFVDEVAFYEHAQEVVEAAEQLDLDEVHWNI